MFDCFFSEKMFAFQLISRWRNDACLFVVCLQSLLAAGSRIADSLGFFSGVCGSRDYWDKITSLTINILPSPFGGPPKKAGFPGRNEPWTTLNNNNSCFFNAPRNQTSAFCIRIPPWPRQAKTRIACLLDIWVNPGVEKSRDLVKFWVGV